MRFIPAIVRGQLVLLLLLGLLVSTPVHVRAAEGDVWGWGANTFGQLGNGATTSSQLPTPTNAIPGGIIAIDAGYEHTLALNTVGNVYAWGENRDGQLGDGTDTSYSDTPVLVDTLTDIIAVSGGHDFSLALDDDGHVWAWGNNDFGQLGNGTTDDSNVPVLIDHLNDITAIAAGGRHSMALDADGIVYTWGDNQFGQLGNGTTVDSDSPVTTTALDGIRILSISAGNFHSLAASESGDVYAWGDNAYSQLADDTAALKSDPALVPGLTGIVQVAAGYSHSLALDSDGVVYGWGRSDDGQVGSGTDDRSTPTPQQVMIGVGTIAAGSWHSIALTTSGVAWTWGINLYGQIGDGSTEKRYVPVEVDTTLRFSAISGGYYHTIAIEMVPPDTTPPSINPLDDLVLDPINPFGAPVVFEVIASDDTTPVDDIQIECVDPDGIPFESGDFAPIGTTTITCTATDALQNVSTASFQVTVRSAGDLLDDLRALIMATSTGTAQQQTMLTYAAVADGAIDANAPQIACMTTTVLDVYIHSQVSRRRIPTREAALLYAETAHIRTVLGCGSQQ